MKLLCPKSGLLWEAPEFGNFGTRYSLMVDHPMFSLTSDALLSKIEPWIEGAFNERECRLLFLALLNTLESKEGKLIVFRVAANPSHGTVQQYMERLFRFVAWYNDVMTPNISLPMFVVDKQNTSLDNIKYWIERWEECKHDWEHKAIASSLARSDRSKKAQEAVTKVLTHAIKTRRDWKALASWAMDASSAPMKYREVWSKLFCVDTASFKVYELDHNEIMKLLDHMESFLDHFNSHIMAASVMERIRDIEMRNRVGINHALGMSVFNMLPDDLLRAVKMPFSFVEDNVERVNKAIIAASAPLSEPKKQEYPTMVAYIKALSAWRLAQAEAERQVSERASRIDASNNEVLAASFTDEEAEQDHRDAIASIVTQVTQQNKGGASE